MATASRQQHKCLQPIAVIRENESPTIGHIDVSEGRIPVNPPTEPLSAAILIVQQPTTKQLVARLQSTKQRWLNKLEAAAFGDSEFDGLWSIVDATEVVPVGDWTIQWANDMRFAVGHEDIGYTTRFETIDGVPTMTVWLHKGKRTLVHVKQTNPTTKSVMAVRTVTP